MKRATLIVALTSLTTAMAVAASVVVFGFLYVLQVQPERKAAIAVERELERAHGDLVRRRAQAVPAVPASLKHAVTTSLTSPDLGSVSNVLVEADAFGGAATVTFDARYQQILRFLRGLPPLPGNVDLQSIEIEAGTPSQSGLMRATVSLRPPQPAPVSAPAPQQRSATVERRRAETRAAPQPAQPPLVVSSILTSNGRRVALVEGQVVRQGDRVRTGLVQAIEADAVVIAEAGGSVHRVELARNSIPAVQR